MTKSSLSEVIRQNSELDNTQHASTPDKSVLHNKVMHQKGSCSTRGGRKRKRDSVCDYIIKKAKIHNVDEDSLPQPEAEGAIGEKKTWNDMANALEDSGFATTVVREHLECDEDLDGLSDHSDDEQDVPLSEVDFQSPNRLFRAQIAVNTTETKDYNELSIVKTLKEAHSNTTNSPDDSPMMGGVIGPDDNLVDDIGWGITKGAAFSLDLPKENIDPKTNKFPVFAHAHTLICDETLSSPMRRPSTFQTNGLAFETLQSSPAVTCTNTPKSPPLVCRESSNGSMELNAHINNYNDTFDDEEVDMTPFFSMRTIKISEPDPDDQDFKPEIRILELNIKRIKRPKALACNPQTPHDQISLISPELYNIEGKDDEFAQESGLQHPDLGIMTNEMFNFWLDREQDVKYRMEDCTPVPEHVRAVIINWMIEVSYELGFHRQTLQTAVNFFDRYNAHAESHPIDLHQPLAVTALYIASKRDELEPRPEFEFTKFIAMYRITVAQFVAMEQKMMEFLDYRLSPVTYFDWVCMFLRRAALIRPKELGVVPSSKVKTRDISIRTDLFFEISVAIDIWIHCNECIRFSPSIVSACSFLFVLNEKLSKYLPQKDIDILVSRSTGFSSDAIRGSECYCALESRVFMRKDFFPQPDPLQDFRNDVYLQPLYTELPSYLLAPINDLETAKADKDVSFACLV